MVGATRAARSERGAALRACAAVLLLVALSPVSALAGIVPHVPVPQVHVTVPKVHVVTPGVHVPVTGSRTVHVSTPHLHLPAFHGGLAKGVGPNGPRPNLTASWRNGRGVGNKQAVPIVQKTNVLPGASTQKNATVEKSSSNMKAASTTSNSNGNGGQTIFDPACYGSGGSCGGCYLTGGCITASYPNGNAGYATCMANCALLPSLPVSIQCGTFGICGPVATPPPTPVVSMPSTPSAPTNPKPNSTPSFPDFPSAGTQTQACAACLPVLLVGAAAFILYRYSHYGTDGLGGLNFLTDSISSFRGTGGTGKGNTNPFSR